MAAPAHRSGGESGRWDPGAELTDIALRIRPPRDSMPAAPFGDGQTLQPLADGSETETEDGYVVEVPGVTREDLDITLSANELEITGEFVEKKTGGCAAAPAAPAASNSAPCWVRDVDADKVTALAEGVLTVTIPKTASARSRRIEVTTD